MTDERLKALSAAGDPLERLAAMVDCEVFRAELETALARSDRAKGGRPPYDSVLMFKALVLQTLYTLSDDATEYQLKDRLLFVRFAAWRCTTRSRRPRRSGCSASNSPAPAPSSGCSSVSTPSCASGAIWRWAGRSSTRR